MSRLAFVALALLFAAGPAWGLRATPHLDALEATLGDRAASLAGAVDKTGKKQRKAAEKSLARIAVDTATLADDLKLAKKLAGPVAKAYTTDDEVIGLLTGAADAFENEVDDRASVLARARAPLPEAKLTKKADRLLGKAEKAREKAGTQTKLKKRLSLLYKAQRHADKAADVLATALGDPTPTRLVVSPESALFTASGETRSFSATVLDQLDRPLATAVSWSSTNISVAAVDASGSATGGDVGSAQIIATAGTLEARAVVVSARPAAGAIPIPDSAVVGSLLASDPEHFGIGAEYTAVLRGDAPAIGALLYGTGELPLGGEVVAVEPLGDEWLVTLAIVPLDVLFAELEIRETLPLSNEHAVVPEEISEAFDVELLDDGTWVFTEPEGAEALARLQPRADLFKVQVGPFECKSPAPFPVSLAAGISLQLHQGLELDLEYTTTSGLERFVLAGPITATASFKPRLAAAISGSVECKAELVKVNRPLPAYLGLLFGAQIPIGIGFKIEGSIQAAQFGFDAVAQFQSTTSAGIQCVTGNCEPVTTSANTSTATFSWVTPDPSTQFTVTAALRGFGYGELCLGNPLWDVLQLCMLEAQGGIEQTLSWSPTSVQLNNTTLASDYKLLQYFLIGAKAELMDVLDFFNVSLASLQYRADLELARSPEGSFSFEEPVALGETARATLQLTNVDYLGRENVRDVRFYRRDSALSLIQKAVVQRASAGQTTYVAEWPVTSGDVGAEFGAVVVTEILPLEFEVENNSLKTLGQGASGTVELTGRFHSISAAVHDSDGAPSIVDEFDGNVSPAPTGRFERTFSADGFGSTAGVQHLSDIVVGGGSVERIEFSTSGNTAGPDEGSAARDFLEASFVVADAVAYTMTANATLMEPVGVAYARLSRIGGGFFECAAATDSVDCSGFGSSVSSSGTLLPGVYRMTADMTFGHQATLMNQGAVSIVLTFGN